MDDVRQTIKSSDLFRNAQDRICEDQGNFFTSIGGALMWVVLGALLGAVAMWAFDPTMGWARREEMSEQAHRATGQHESGTGPSSSGF